MIRTDRMHQWAPTQMHMDPIKPPLPKGCDYQGRFPEAAHAATEVDAEPSDPYDWLTPGRFWAVYAIAVVCALLLGTSWGMR